MVAAATRLAPGIRRRRARVPGRRPGSAISVCRWKLSPTPLMVRRNPRPVTWSTTRIGSSSSTLASPGAQCARGTESPSWVAASPISGSRPAAARNSRRAIAVIIRFTQWQTSNHAKAIAAASGSDRPWRPAAEQAGELGHRGLLARNGLGTPAAGYRPRLGEPGAQPHRQQRAYGRVLSQQQRRSAPLDMGASDQRQPREHPSGA